MTEARNQRLASDEAGLRRLERESEGRVVIEATEGRPPKRYTLALRCRGVVALAQGVPRFGDLHRIDVVLGARYPLAAPEVRFLTPTFNPHVFADGRVCLGFKTDMTERLEDLVVRVGRLIQYDPELIDRQSPANWAALRFAESVFATLPFGRETFKVARPAAAPRVVWMERRPS